jgi:hypothetical protein
VPSETYLIEEQSIEYWYVIFIFSVCIMAVCVCVQLDRRSVLLLGWISFHLCRPYVVRHFHLFCPYRYIPKYNFRAVPCRKLSGAGLSLWSPEFDSRPIRVGLLMYKMALEHVTFRRMQTQYDASKNNPVYCYTRINSIKSSTSGAGNVIERRLICIRRVREFVCA